MEGAGEERGEEKKVTLTRRRKEFLTKINKIYNNTGEPVRYATVAKSLGVSKWTAYDVLRELEKEGLLTMEYLINREDRYPGRSQVFFRPTILALHTLEEEPYSSLPEEEWLKLKKRLLGVFDNIKNLGAKKIIDELSEEMRIVEKPVAYGAYMITLLTAYLYSLGNRGIHLLENSLRHPSKPELTLSMFAGTVLGMAIKNVKETVTAKLAAKIDVFQKHISGFSKNERKLLVNFLGEALQRAII